MHFARPDNLYLLLLLVPMALAACGYFWWKRQLASRLGHTHLIRAMATRHSNRRQVARTVLVIVAAALLSVAAAQPQWGQNDRTVKRLGVDVVFALDLSNSMLAQDVPPSRLQAAKDEVLTATRMLGGDRVGLVVFTAISFAQSPLTTDYGAIRFYLDKLQPRQMPVGGTSVGQAILDSVELLTGEKVDPNGDETGKDKPESEGIDRADNQIIVLITDGEDHESSPLEAARVAREHGIRVVTVGMGSADGSRIPIYGESGQLKGYKRDAKGELVYTSLDEKTLQDIATETGGTYLRYSGEHSVANGLGSYIDRLEKSELETMLRKSYEDRFMYFLAPALFLLVLALLLGERRRREPGAPNRADRGGSSSTLMVLLVLLLAASSMGCDDAFRDTVSEVDRANALIAQDEYEEALEQYREAEKVVPSSPEMHYNRGIALLGTEDFDRAREAFARALEGPEPELRFDALFNLGLTLARQENWKEAYATYKQALGIELDETLAQNRERIDKARHNLEVVFRRLFPPCAQLEDDLEDNDEPEAASQLEQLEAEDLALCGLDDDWFVVPAIVGTSVSVEASFEQLRDEPDPEHVFLPRPQDLQLAVFDARGEEVVAVDQGSPTDFKPGAKRATRTIDKFTVTPEMVGQGQSQLLLKVSATDAREFSYDVDVTAIPPCAALDDDYEPNDRRPEAADIAPGNHELHICPGQDDWYAVDLELGDTLFVDIAAGEDRERERPPELGVEIVAADTGEVVSAGRVEEPYVTAGVREVTEPGRYLVRVFGKGGDEQGPYTADIYRYEPCVVGDDRYEENDTASQAADLEQGKTTHRYLRLCDTDRDFFRLPPKEDARQNPQQDPQQDPQQGARPGPAQPGQPQPDDDQGHEVSWGLSLVEDSTGASAPESADSAEEDQPPALDIVSRSGDQILAEGQIPEVLAEADADAHGDAQDDANGNGDDDQEEGPQPPAVDRVATYQNEDNEELLLRVQGEQTFYHLTELNPQQQNNNDQNDQNEQSDQQQDQQSDQQQQDEGDSDEESDPKEDESDQEQEQNDQQEQDKQDEQEKSDESDDEKKQEEQARPSQPEPADPEERRVEDILRALEESDDNFQMKKALEDMPRRYIEKDW